MHKDDFRNMCLSSALPPARTQRTCFFLLAAGKLLPWMCTSFFSVQKTVCSCGHSHM